MDPYLEGSLWTTVHTQLSAEIVRQLTPRLRPRYLALTTERLAADGPPRIAVEIQDATSRQLVTAIEVLLATDKRLPGRLDYLAKRQRLLFSTAHLMEIDLLHGGQRVPFQGSLPAAPYYVLLRHARNRDQMAVWPIPLAKRLPIVSVPLLSGDADVTLDLQLALTTIYDLCGYDMAVNYAAPPEVRLPQDEERWAEELLRAAGFRT